MFRRKILIETATSQERRENVLKVEFLQGSILVFLFVCKILFYESKFWSGCYLVWLWWPANMCLFENVNVCLCVVIQRKVVKDNFA